MQRRDFLRGLGAAAASVGVAAVLTKTARAKADTPKKKPQPKKASLGLLGGAAVTSVALMPNGAPRITDIGMGYTPIYTPTRMWRFGPWNDDDNVFDDGHWDAKLTVYCHHCSNTVATPQAILDRIKYLNPGGGIEGCDPTAWADKHLICGCPNCGAPLKSNPFVCDSSSWHDPHLVGTKTAAIC